jgi:nitronate monooxygenase
MRAVPRIIQGGMGIGVSNWQLAQAVSRLGHLGVVSGTAVDTVMIRRLQDGDEGGHVQRAMQAFPAPEVCEQVMRRFLRPHGRQGKSYALQPMLKQTVSV